MRKREALKPIVYFVDEIGSHWWVGHSVANEFSDRLGPCQDRDCSWFTRVKLPLTFVRNQRE